MKMINAAGKYQHDCVALAMKFVLNLIEDDGSPDSMSIRASLERELSIRMVTVNNSILTLPTPDHRRYLENELVGTSTWNKLSQSTQRDLIEAEKLWCHAAVEAGASSRQDWGSLITLYSRAIEAEVYKHLRPVILSLEERGYCESKSNEFTLGGCIRGLRSYKKLKKQADMLPLEESLRSRVEQLTQFFAGEHDFVEGYRNFAAHGNREKPISITEFIKWRIMMYQNGVFDVILGEK